MKLSRLGIAWLLLLAAAAGGCTVGGAITHDPNLLYGGNGMVVLILTLTWACTYQYEIGEALRYMRIGWKVARVPYREKTQFLLDQTKLPLPGSW